MPDASQTDAPRPSGLRRLDDRVLGRFRRPAGSSGRSGPADVLAAVVRVAQLVLVVLALVLLLAIAAVVLPTDEDNVLVRGVLDAALQVAGPFATVFDIAGRNARAAANYGLGAAVYLLAAKLLGRLSPKR
ncbi:MAG: hypothetical protein JWN17_2755 [Frankiales bacterium]|nr:hypothetical protein [Frankiales bacterium]